MDFSPICRLSKTGLVIFSLSNFDGYNLYAQVAHLTKLDGGIYPEIKSDMKTYLPTYVEKYANKGEYALNWVIYGSASDEMLAQIGPRSPIVSVNEYLGANSNMQRANKIFRVVDRGDYRKPAFLRQANHQNILEFNTPIIFDEVW